MQALAQEPAHFRPADTFTLLQSPTRLRILEVLRLRKQVAFVDLADHLQLSNLKLNYHLELLADAGLVRFRKTSHERSLCSRLIIFRPVGWARLRQRWAAGMQRL